MSENRDQFQFISQLSAVPAAGLVRLPILVTGSWVKGGHEVSFTRDDLETAAANFYKLANHDLNVDYDHACEDLERAAGEPTPSAGRIVALDEPEEFERGNGESGVGNRENQPLASHSQLPNSNSRWILYGRYEPTARARQLIKEREYRYVSAAFARDYPDRKTGSSQGLTLTSVALTNQPFLDELPEIRLSIRSGNGESGVGGREEPNSQIPTPNSLDSTRLSAEQGGTMAKLTLKCSAEGKHEAWDGDRKVGDFEADELYQYAAQHAPKGTLSTRGAGLAELSATETFAAFARQVGAEGRSVEEIRGFVALATHPADEDLTLLSGAIGVNGRLDASRLDALDDSGTISRAAWRRAKDAEQRVQNAFQRGQITPAMLASGAPLRLALSDGAAFKSLVEDRPAIVKPNAVVGLGGSGAETGESPRQTFARLIDEKKQELMSSRKLSELEASREAQGLISKHNPELLKNYRADAKSA